MSGVKLFITDDLFKTLLIDLKTLSTIIFLGQHSTEVAFVLLTQLPGFDSQHTHFPIRDISSGTA